MDVPATQEVVLAARLCVLASGSSGNCSVLALPGRHGWSVCLIDAGLSPRRTITLLSRLGISPDEVCGIILTHLDHDHWHSGWARRWPRRWLLWMSRLHSDFGKRH